MKKSRRRAARAVEKPKPAPPKPKPTIAAESKPGVAEGSLKILGEIILQLETIIRDLQGATARLDQFKDFANKAAELVENSTRRPRYVL